MKRVELAHAEIRRVEPDWDSETLLTQTGIFFLKDVCKNIEDIDPVIVKRPIKGISELGQDPWRVIGVRKMANIGWVLSMPIFVLWGDKDSVLNVSCVESFKRFLPHVEKVVILKDCGHIPMMEQPPIDSVTRVSKALVEIGMADGL